MPVYTGKCDPHVCCSYRAIKLLEQPMKVLEKVMEKRIRCQVSIHNMPFGFMSGKGATGAIFIMRQVQERHQASKKTLYYAFVEWETAFDKSPERGGEMGFVETVLWMSGSSAQLWHCIQRIAL